MGPPAKLRKPLFYKGLGLILVPVEVGKPINGGLCLVRPFRRMIFGTTRANLHPVVSGSAVAIGRTVAIVFVVHTSNSLTVWQQVHSRVSIPWPTPMQDQLWFPFWQSAQVWGTAASDCTSTLRAFFAFKCATNIASTSCAQVSMVLVIGCDPKDSSTRPKI